MHEACRYHSLAQTASPRVATAIEAYIYNTHKLQYMVAGHHPSAYWNVLSQLLQLRLLRLRNLHVSPAQLPQAKPYLVASFNCLNCMPHSRIGEMVQFGVVGLSLTCVLAFEHKMCDFLSLYWFLVQTLEWVQLENCTYNRDEAWPPGLRVQQDGSPNHRGGCNVVCVRDGIDVPTEWPSSLQQSAVGLVPLAFVQ
jgi:hypothetical protein